MEQPFYVIAREPGAENPAIPTWASRVENPLALAESPSAQVVRQEVPEVPGGYQLFNVLADAECDALIRLSETLGYQQDAAVSLPREIRHNDNFVWVADDTTVATIWRRVAAQAARELEMFDNKRPVGLNGRFRFYRYGSGDYFKPHTDGAWPGSRVVDGRLVNNAYDDRYSQMTVLLFLNDDYQGGATRFMVDAHNPHRPARYGAEYGEVDVKTPRGGALCFPHGMHPLHCVHSSEPIVAGSKYIIRTDMLFEL